MWCIPLPGSSVFTSGYEETINFFWFLINLENLFAVSSLQVPKSPRTPTVTRGMGHMIAHRFTKTFKMMTTCDYCEKQMFIGTGLKCTECKYKCHRDCESKVPPSCGLPQQLFDEFKRTLQADGTLKINYTFLFLCKNQPYSRFLERLFRE